MPVSTLLSEEEFLNLPEYPGRQEFRDGELIEVPPAKKPHNDLVVLIFDLLRTVLDRSRVRIETGFRLRPGRWVIPDMCVTWPEQEIVDGWFVRSPMVAIEVASRGNTPDQLQQKVLDYLECGAGEVLVIYPKSRTMVVHRPAQTLTIAADADYCCDLIGVTLTPEYRTEIA